MSLIVHINYGECHRHPIKTPDIDLMFDDEKGLWEAFEYHPNIERYSLEDARLFKVSLKELGDYLSRCLHQVNKPCPLKLK